MENPLPSTSWRIFAVIAAFVMFIVSLFIFSSRESLEPRSANIEVSHGIKTDGNIQGNIIRVSGPDREVQLASATPVSGTESSTVVEVGGDVTITIPSKTAFAPLENIDQLLESLGIGNIAFNTPETLQLGQPKVIHLVLSVRKSIDELKSTITVEGKKEGHNIRISDQMAARLSGLGFKIEAITPEAQAISQASVTEWKWLVEATKTNKQSLFLTISVLLDTEKASRIHRQIITFEKKIDVQVTWDRKVVGFVYENWQWLWATFLVPIGAWVMRKRRDRTSSDDDGNSTA